MDLSKRTLVRAIVAGLVILVAGIGIGVALSNGPRTPGDSTGDASAPEATPTDDTTDSAEPAESAGEPDTGSPGSPSPDTSEDGRHFAYIRDVTDSGGEMALTVDYAQMLTGDEAAAAAAAAGEESPPPNDYFIVNENTRLRTFPADTSTLVTLTSKSDGVDPAGYDVAFGVWYDMYVGMIAGSGFTRDVPYWITIERGTITRIEEQYLP